MVKKGSEKISPPMEPMVPSSLSTPARKPEAEAGAAEGRELIKVLALIRTETTRAKVLYALKPLAEVAVQVIGRNLDSLQYAMPDGSMPSAVLFDADVSNPEDLEQIRDLKKQVPFGVSVVALTDRSTDLAALRAIRSGADDVLLMPIEADEAREVFGRIRNLKTGDKNRGEGSRTIVFMHCMGGAGATTLAVNAAIAMTERSKTQRSCLLDLDIQFGICASLLDLPTSSPVENLFDDPTRLDREMLDNMMLLHESGLRVLTAPKTPLPLESLEPRTVSEILRHAKRSFQYIFVDLPVALAPWTETVMRSATTVYLVSELSVPAVQRMNRLFDLFRAEELTQIPLKVVINKNPASLSHSGELTVAQFGKAIGRQVDHVIREDRTLIASSHNHGRPAWAWKRNSSFAQSLEEMLSKDLEPEAFSASQRGFRLPFLKASG